MFDAALSFLPPGAHVVESQVRWERFAIFSRLASLPTALAR
jgi:hypothetical protein